MYSFLILLLGYTIVQIPVLYDPESLIDIEWDISYRRSLSISLLLIVISFIIFAAQILPQWAFFIAILLLYFLIYWSILRYVRKDHRLVPGIFSIIIVFSIRFSFISYFLVYYSGNYIFLPPRAITAFFVVYLPIATLLFLAISKFDIGCRFLSWYQLDFLHTMFDIFDTSRVINELDPHDTRIYRKIRNHPIGLRIIRPMGPKEISLRRIYRVPAALILLSFPIFLIWHTLMGNRPVPDIIMITFLVVSDTIILENILREMTYGEPRYYELMSAIIGIYIGIIPVFLYPNINLVQLSLSPLLIVLLVYLFWNGAEMYGILIMLIGFFTILFSGSLGVMFGFLFGDPITGGLAEIIIQSLQEGISPYILIFIVETIWVTGCTIAVYGITRTKRNTWIETGLILLGTVLISGAGLFLRISGRIIANQGIDEFLGIRVIIGMGLIINGFVAFCYGDYLHWKRVNWDIPLKAGSVLLLGSMILYSYLLVVQPAALDLITESGYPRVVSILVVAYSILAIFYGLYSYIHPHISANIS